MTAADEGLDRSRIIRAFTRLGDYFASPSPALENTVEAAVRANPWFTTGGVQTALHSISSNFLEEATLRAWAEVYPFATTAKTVGIVAAGNIPLVGFHDLLCVLISGHRAQLKPSAKDTVLMRHVADKLVEELPALADRLELAERLHGCDAYIATGSNNSGRYFRQYFGTKPALLRGARTSVAVLDGTETRAELRLLADDVFTFFGLGCRNVTQVIVPDGYDFVPLLDALYSYEDLTFYHKYKNNYDYHLAVYLLNRVPYMTNERVLLVENNLPFSAVSVLHYRYCADLKAGATEALASTDVQVVVGKEYTPFGTAQSPALPDYADGVDTMSFLAKL